MPLHGIKIKNGTINTQTPRKKITIANGNRKSRKNKQFADHSRVGSISDSTFKFLFEDCNSTLKYITQHNLEHNIRLRRGFTAAQIVDLAEDQLQQLASNGVKDIIATFGAVDIQIFAQLRIKNQDSLHSQLLTLYYNLSL